MEIKLRVTSLHQEIVICSQFRELSRSPGLQAHPSIHLKNHGAQDAQVKYIDATTLLVPVRLGFDQSKVRSAYLMKTSCSGNELFDKLE